MLTGGDSPAPPFLTLVLTGGVLDANGCGSVTIGIPGDPVLIGLPLLVWGAVIHAQEPIRHTLTRYTPFVIAP